MSENVKLSAAISALVLCAILAFTGVGGLKSTVSSAQQQEEKYIPSSAQEQKQKLHDTAEEIDHAKSSISRGVKMAEDNADAVERRSAEHEAIRREVDATMSPVREAAASQAATMEAEHARMRARFEANNH